MRSTFVMAMALAAAPLIAAQTNEDEDPLLSELPDGKPWKLVAERLLALDAKFDQYQAEI